MKARRALGCRLSKARDQIAMILGRIEIKEVVVNFDAITDELDRVSVAQPVVVQMKCLAAFGDRTARMFGKRNRSVANVVIDFDVFVVLERELDREVYFDRVVMHMTAFPLAAFYSVKLVLSSPAACV